MCRLRPTAKSARSSTPGPTLNWWSWDKVHFEPGPKKAFSTEVLHANCYKHSIPLLRPYPLLQRNTRRLAISFARLFSHCALVNQFCDQQSKQSWRKRSLNPTSTVAKDHGDIRRPFPAARPQWSRTYAIGPADCITYNHQGSPNTDRLYDHGCVRTFSVAEPEPATDVDCCAVDGRLATKYQLWL